MRILHVNKFLYRRGGAEAYMQGVADYQRAAGHEVEFFGMAHPVNGALTYAGHFPTQVEFDRMPSTLTGKARATARMMYSTSARRGMSAVLSDFRPDVVHLHNIYHALSPSILAPVRSRRIPAVMTLHDYKLACPTYRFLDKDQICEACLGGHFYQAALRRCKGGSFGASAMNGLELAFHTYTHAYEPVGIFSCPSRFLAEKMKEAGVYPDRMRVLNNFVNATTIPVKEKPGGPLVYAGRLSSEKGVDVLIDALALLDDDVHLEVAGEGDQQDALEARAQARAPGRVRFHGRLPRDEALALMRSGSAMVLPSRWYENQPMAVLESLASGVPVVASNLGGHPELVDPGRDGLLVPANDPAALAAALRQLLEDPGAALLMGRAGRQKVVEQFSPSSHLRRLQELYAEAAERWR